MQIKKHRKNALLSLVLGLSLAVGAAAPASAAPREENPAGKPNLNPFVTVVDTVEDGEQLDLTQEGSLDWILVSNPENFCRKEMEAGQNGIIGFEKLISGDIGYVGDSKMKYKWTKDEESKEGTVAGAFTGKGDSYKISLPEAAETRMLTFVSGTWEASAELQICVNSGTTPVYTTHVPNSLRKYTMIIREGNAVEVKMKVTNTTHKDGNVSLGGIALKTAEPSAISVKVDAPSSGQTMNLTQRGDVDWIHFEGEEIQNGRTPQTVRKSGVTPVISYKKLENTKKVSSMDDAPVTYSWSDGDPEKENTGTRYGAVYVAEGGQNADVEGRAGYELKVAPADYTRELVFVSGVWQANAEISITLDGETKPVYENKELKAGGSAVNKIYTVTIAEGKGLTVTGLITRKNDSGDGNFNLQAAALSKNQTLSDFKNFLKDELTASQKENLGDYQEPYASRIEAEIKNAEELLKDEKATNNDFYIAYLFLKQAREDLMGQKLPGQYKYQSNSRLVASFGWEGDIDAPIAYIDGSYGLRDKYGTTGEWNGNSYNPGKMVTFGIKDIPGEIKWYNAEGYLPCFVSEYAKEGMEYKIENFANKHTIDGNDFEVAYSRMTVKNTTGEDQTLPRVASGLIPVNDAARQTKKIASGETVAREYAIVADRFGGKYDYPADEKVAGMGGFDKNYEAMKKYWNDRLAPLSTIEELPNEKLINAYKAGFIYTLIIRDDVKKENGEELKELHVGENGYDIMFDHDTIGIVATLLTIGDFSYAKEYLATLPAQLQYDDAKWKYSWPYAVYLQKTNDLDFIVSKYHVIKTNTHNVDTDRDQSAGGIIKRTNAIDSNGYWLIDNWAALAGLTTYKYLCERLDQADPQQEYKTEIKWAEDTYKDLLKCVEAKQRKMREDNNYPYLSIDMERTTENSERKDVRDANWASMFLFGRWAWDGYLFGADQEGSEMLSLIDATYEHGFNRRKDITDTIYNFGGYPHGYYSSAYNAGYGSSALRGEKYRESGIRAYEFMIDKAMSGPFGWWEGVDYPDEASPWDSEHAKGGGGSCQHMWGQSTATKVLFDALIAEKLGDKVIIGRGIPTEWNLLQNTPVKIKDYTVEGSKKVGYEMSTEGKTITVEFTGDKLAIPYSIELIALKNNISKVTVDGNALEEGINVEAGTVLVQPGSKKVQITMGINKNALNAAIERAKDRKETDYTAASWKVFQDALKKANEMLKNEEASQQEVTDATTGLRDAIAALVRVNKSSLKKAIADADTREASDYTEGSWKAMQTALAKAKEVSQNANALQKDVDEAFNGLSAALYNLERIKGVQKEALAVAIGRTESLQESDYRATAWTEFQTVLQTAKQVLENTAVTQDQVNEATIALRAALDQLAKSIVYKSGLKAAIDRAGSRNESDYQDKPDEWAAMLEALAKAREVEANTDATQKEVDDAARELSEALRSLEPEGTVNKDALQAAIDWAKELREEDYTATSWNTLKKALGNAEALFADMNAVQTDVNAAAEALRAARRGLVRVNKSGLTVAIESAEARTEADYTAETWKVMLEALTAAKTVVQNADAIQTEVDTATFNLREALRNLKEAKGVNKDTLSIAIERARTYQEAGHTATSWKKLQDALQKANEVMEKTTATQEEADTALTALQEAMAALVKVDKSGLTEAIKRAEARNEEEYPADSWAAMQEALKNAKTVEANADALQKDVDKATYELSEALRNLDKTNQGMANLTSALEAAKTLKKEDYTPEAWNAFQKALAEAESILKNPKTTNEQAAAAAAALEKATEQLKKNPSKQDINTPGAAIKVKKITISGLSKKIAAGKKVKLTAKISPSDAADKGVIWKSSNKKVATVNSKGIVSMKRKSGGKSVTITATAKDGSQVKAVYKIKSMKGKVTKVNISGKKTLKAGKSLKLTGKVKSTKNANKKLKWISSNKKYATVTSSGKVKALKAGIGKRVKITAMATDGSGKKKTVTIKIVK